MIHKRIDLISADDIHDLVNNSVQEGKTIEYKQQLPDQSVSQTKEFLADASSFANASGGTIVYGVIEARDASGKNTGIPERIKGIPNINADEEILRLEQKIRSGIEPRIPGIGLRAISGFDEGPVIVLQIPRSWTSPHMVTFQASPRFFSRTSAGKAPLNVPEIKAAFIQSEELPQRIRRFREERLGLIISGETPVPLPQSPLVILHLVPLVSFLNQPFFDVLDFLDGKAHLRPIGVKGWHARLNIDGYVSFCGNTRSNEEQLHYAQIFRNGIIETADAYILSLQGNTDRSIPSTRIEEDLLCATEEFFDAYRAIGISGPVVAMLSLIHVRGFDLAVDTKIRNFTPSRIEKTNLLFPDIVIESIDAPVDLSLKPMLDMLWQACGFRYSYNYHEGGRRRPWRQI